MNWSGGRESSNVEDDSSGSGGGGMGGGFKLGGGVTLIIIIISLVLGKNPMQLLNQVGGSGQPAQSAPAPAGQYGGNAPTNQYGGTDPSAANGSASSDVNTTGRQGAASTKMPETRERKFVGVILAQTEDVWDSIFKSMGKIYKDPKLHLFRGSVRSGCGNASAASGPFYCPADKKVYLDLSFFEEMKDRFHAPGDLADAYVISHEVGHHVQDLLGISQQMDDARSRLSQVDYNKLSVKLELQADFFAGVFIHYDQKMHQILQPGDIESALAAAHAVGDDNLQKQMQGTIVPDAFTHGSSAQRMYWFKKGFETGDIRQGDTFHNDR